MQTIKWSHSGLKDFEGCARRFHEVKVLKKYPQKETEQMRYGTELHLAAEEFVRDGKPIPPQFSFMEPLLAELLKLKGRIFPEFEMGATTDLLPCSFSDANVWVRGIADLLVVNDDNFTARIIDYKTGNNKYPDTSQLELMALLTFIHFPQVKEVDSALLFVVKNSMVTHHTSREDADKLWWNYRQRVAKLNAAHEHGVWNPTSTPLCGWCPVKTCEFHPNH